MMTTCILVAAIDFVLATKGSQREGPGGAHASVSDGGRWMGRVTYPGQSFQRMEAAPVGSTKHSLTLKKLMFINQNKRFSLTKKH